jgi:hypothetical protein
MSQTFKSRVDKDILFDFLKLNCEKTEKYYVFNLTSYKRGELNDSNNAFLESLKPYYHKAKLFYLERKHTYSGLCTILRQICKAHSILYSTKVVYSKSKYNIPYFIYF